jgi:hypothetical protein
MFLIKNGVKTILRQFGYDVFRAGRAIPLADRQHLDYTRFRECELEINLRHDKQTLENVKALRKKYSEPIFGKMPIMELLRMLGQCHDPTDSKLAGLSQLTHCLQVAEAMESDGVTDPALLIVALVHDLGKLLSLVGELPENIVCMNTTIGEHAPGSGWDQCTFQWNHDEFVYQRLKHHLPDHLSWLLRYHSVWLSKCEVYMNAVDSRNYNDYLRAFARYDQESKSIYKLPQKNLEHYREVLERYFPEPVLF